jgi:class II lanthipeptide synthase
VPQLHEELASEQFQAPVALRRPTDSRRDGAHALSHSTSEDGRVSSIAARAAPLWERTGGGVSATPTSVSTRRRTVRWRKILGDATLLNRRLRNAGVDRHLLDGLLRGSSAVNQLPSWVLTFVSAIRASVPCREGANEIPDRSFDETHPLPFQDVLVGFIRHARARLAADTGRSLKVLGAAALVDLERQLLAHLAFVASLAIGRDFYAFRFACAPASAIEEVWRRQPPSTDIYSTYVRHIRGGGLVSLFDAHPVLARLLSQSIEQWVSASAGLCQRFEEDFSDLRALFGWTVETPDDAVESLRTELSDRHHGARTVTECILRTGERVIYKPRSVQPEIAFNRFVAWLNARGLSLDLRVTKACDCGTHGWVESVTSEPCRSEPQVDRFYRRAGMLLCVLHVLATTDIHSENVIASGEHPVIVDLETLLTAVVPASPGSSDHGGGHSDQDSVLRTGFLPRWQAGLEGRQYDSSALGADDAQDPGIRLPEWQATNTDQMTFGWNGRPQEAMTHRVCLGGRWPTLAEYLPAFQCGFREAYSCFLQHRRDLVSDRAPMIEFDHLDLRVLLRDSITYARLHLHLLHPEFMVDGIDRSIELEWLARPLSATTIPLDSRARVYEEERAAMERLDIPHFVTSVWRGMQHPESDPDLRRLAEGRDSRMIRRRLDALSEDDCAIQLSAIEAAVHTRFGHASVMAT